MTRHSKRDIGILAPVFLALPLLVWVAGPREVSAQETRGDGTLFIDRVDVNLVNVEVMVTSNGEPVLGLGPSDFVIYDDGEPVAITNFYAVEEGLRSVAGAPAVASRDEAALTLPRERSFLVVVIDNTFIAPPQRAQVFAALRRKLDALLFEGGQVMVVTKDRTVKIEQTFTAERDLIDAALDQAARTAGSGGLAIAGERIVLSQIEQGVSSAFTQGSETGTTDGFGAPDAGGADALMTFSQAQSFAAELFQNARRTTGTLRAFLGTLADLPGRKAILYVSDGFPLSPGELVFRAWFSKYGAAYAEDVGVFSPEEAVVEYDTTQELVELIADANANRVAFYPLMSGLNPVQAAISARSDATIVTAGFALESEAPLAAGLRLLARSTGGDVATELSDLDRLAERLREDMSAFYSLGFPSRHDGDGQVHRLKVMVKRPNVQLRYLNAYRDKSPDQKMQDRTIAALMMEPSENPLLAWAGVGQSKRARGGRFVLPLEVRFPLDRLTLVPEGDNVRGSVSLFIVVRDEDGRFSEPQKIALPVSMPSARRRGGESQGAAYATELRLRKGPQVIAVGVRDDLSNVASTLKLQVDVPN